jgi:hypothetical protein
MGFRAHLSQASIPPARALPAHLSRIPGPDAFLKLPSDSGNHSKLATDSNWRDEALSAWEWDWIDLGGEG